MAELNDDHFYVHTKNRAKKYIDDLHKSYEKWLESCPVQYEKVGMINAPEVRAVHFYITKKGGKK